MTFDRALSFCCHFVIIGLIEHIYGRNFILDQLLCQLNQEQLDNDTGYINTFHGFCVSILQEDSHAVQYPKNFLVLDNQDIDSMLKIIYEERGLTLRHKTFSKARDMIEMYKLERYPNDYLDHIALFTNSNVTDDSDKVKLMTVHAAKGLEFPHVFLCALNEGIFPSKKTSTIEGMEEERRLAFVAMSRAMKSLFLSESHGKNFDGSTRYPSRFILDIDQKFLEYVKKPEDTLIAETKNYIHYSNRYLDGYVAEQTFQVGDKIIHNVFGQGRIKSILSDRNAYMIKFEQIETPRIISFRVPIKRA